MGKEVACTHPHPHPLLKPQKQKQNPKPNAANEKAVLQSNGRKGCFVKMGFAGILLYRRTLLQLLPTMEKEIERYGFITFNILNCLTTEFTYLLPFSMGPELGRGQVGG